MAVYGRRHAFADPESVQQTVLQLLLDGEGALRSTRQIARHMGGRKRAREAVAALRQTGLVRTIGEHAYPTSAAKTFHKLERC